MTLFEKATKIRDTILADGMVIGMPVFSYEEEFEFSYVTMRFTVGHIKRLSKDEEAKCSFAGGEVGGFTLRGGK
jgi:hypothetical protein